MMHPCFVRKILCESLLDIIERQEEADEALQKHWHALEQVVHPEIMDSLEELSIALSFIDRIATNLLGGPDATLRLQHEREREEEGEGEEEEEEREMQNKPFYWTKKCGPRHIAGHNVTLCDKPMLGNNYAYEEGWEDAEPCEDCERIHNEKSETNGK